ncbi:ABC transporter permease, partial [Halobacteriales archaeon QS_8_69_73]
MTTKQESDTRLLMRPLNWLETRSEEVFAYVLLAPAFALLAIVAFFPLVRTFQFSLLSDQVSDPS